MLGGESLLCDESQPEMGVFEAALPRLTARLQLPLRTEPPVVPTRSPNPETQHGARLRRGLCVRSPGFSPQRGP